MATVAPNGSPAAKINAADQEHERSMVEKIRPPKIAIALVRGPIKLIIPSFAFGPSVPPRFLLPRRVTEGWASDLFPPTIYETSQSGKREGGKPSRFQLPTGASRSVQAC